MISVPEPTAVFTAPAASPAANTAGISQGVMRASLRDLCPWPCVGTAALLSVARVPPGPAATYDEHPTASNGTDPAEGTLSGRLFAAGRSDPASRQVPRVGAIRSDEQPEET
ncbi:hypothetical protein Sm713_57550 [Streptomyces sp. TS71-3]|nr:hypothetical protein Sm713_57550 [Streptomyces sp. TS71-3]